MDIQRGKHQRIIVVQESWRESLASLQRARGEQGLGEEELLDTVRQILAALAYLNQMKIVNTNLGRETVMLDGEGRVKLGNYGLGRMTHYGSWVSFPAVSDPRTAAPEVLRLGTRPQEPGSPPPQDQQGDVNISHIPAERPPPYSPSCDTWSLGILLAAVSLDIPVFWPEARVAQVVRKVLSLGNCESGAAVLERLSREHGCVGRVATIPQSVLDIIHACLTPCSTSRPSPEQLLLSDLVPGPCGEEEYQYSPPMFPSLSLRCASLPCPPPPPSLEPLERLTLQEIYHLWQLAGGDVQAELRKHGLLVAAPPVLSLPSLCTAEGQLFGQPRRRHTLYDRSVVSLACSQLDRSLASLSIEQLAPLVDTQEQVDTGVRNLPLVIREKDVKYQVTPHLLPLTP